MHHSVYKSYNFTILQYYPMYKLQLYRYATCAFTYHTIFIINQPPVNLSKQFSVTHEISIIIPKEIDIFQTARRWRRFVKHPGYKTPPSPPPTPRICVVPVSFRTRCAKADTATRSERRGRTGWKS